MLANHNRPLTAEELKQHPEFAHTTWSLPAREKGILPCAKDRGGPVNISWEIHGEGPEHMVVSIAFVEFVLSVLMGCCNLSLHWRETYTADKIILDGVGIPQVLVRDGWSDTIMLHSGSWALAVRNGHGKAAVTEMLNQCIAR